MTSTDLVRDPLPLRGRVALVTGVSRRAGIGYAVARRLAALGATSSCTTTRRTIATSRGEPTPAAGGRRRRSVRAGRPGTAVRHLGLDLAAPDAPARLMDAAAEAFGHVDVLVCNHARSGGDGPLGTLDAAMLDAHWAVNTRSVLLLTQAFAARHDGRPGGRVILMTSGQDLGPMRDEVAYASAKGALASITPTLADHLADQGVTLNTVNPGPVDTGYAPPDTHEAVRRRFPSRTLGRARRPGTPHRLARHRRGGVDHRAGHQHRGRLPPLGLTGRPQRAFAGVSGNVTPVISSDTVHSRFATSMSRASAVRLAAPGYPRNSLNPFGPV